VIWALVGQFNQCDLSVPTLDSKPPPEEVLSGGVAFLEACHISSFADTSRELADSYCVGSRAYHRAFG